jgi:hypothetical protein
VAVAVENITANSKTPNTATARPFFETDSESDTAEGLVTALLKDVRLYKGWLSGEDVPNEGSFHPVLNKLLSGLNAKLSWKTPPQSPFGKVSFKTMQIYLNFSREYRWL